MNEENFNPNFRFNYLGKRTAVLRPSDNGWWDRAEINGIRQESDIFQA